MNCVTTDARPTTSDQRPTTGKRTAQSAEHKTGRPTDNGQRTTGNGQRTTDHGQLTTDNGQRATATSRCFLMVLIILLLTACGGTSALSQQTASYTVQLTLDALAVGDRTATVEVHDQAGQPVEAEQIMLTPTMLSMGMASPEVAAQPNGAGRYTGEKLFISMTGDWELDVKIQASGTTEIARFLFTVPTQ